MPGSIEVFADVACPFTHVGLRRFAEHRLETGGGPCIRVRAWPLELLNGEPLTGAALSPKVDALRRQVTPELFDGFDPDRFPASTMPAMAAEAAAYRVGPEVGDRFALLVRAALFERGLDVSDPEILDRLADEVGAPAPTADDEATVRAAFEDGRARGVQGSPHWFTGDADFFCPSLRIEHGDDGLDISYDEDGFRRFVAAAFA